MGDMVLNAVEEMSVVDVYDLASDIGKECEKIIDGYGANAVTALMPKVITVLELLEAMAARNESENTRMQELTDRIAHLESERQEKAVFRERFEKELEAIEEQWRTESNDLMTMVSRLQDENRRILKQQGNSPSHEMIAQPADKLQQQQSAHIGAGRKDDKCGGGAGCAQQATDVQVMQRLRNQLETQRNELKLKDIDLQAKSADVDNLTVQLDRLTNSGRDSRKRQKLLQVQVRSLVEERADFLAQLQDQHREIIALKKRLGIAEKENEDLAKGPHEVDDPHRARFSTAELKEILNERDDLKLHIGDLEEELKVYKPADEPSAEEKTFTGLQKKILRSKGRFRTSPTTHRGRRAPSPAFENSFANSFRSQALRHSLAVLCRPSLRWLYLLAITATLSESAATSHPACTERQSSSFAADALLNVSNVWYIK